ncbi:hypothetical protein [Thalassospira lucentensis]|uniref:hypothetical protein n=1 Tax=Thalassospira lucentensis TaxID=168935 RepID=UPI00142DE04C|nr:hypothetical protein [Thalassospira lucentensis]NIZ03911.1 hypothetical protein [Thalassospira lucentensis]
MSIKILLVEDNEKDRDGFLNSVKRFNHARGTSIQVHSCSDLDEAFKEINGTFDGAVVDMKLGPDGGEGNQFLKLLGDINLRIPVVVFTGTPTAADKQYVHIEVKTKDTSHDEILEDFVLVHASGLTKVMGARGLLEELLGKVYKENILSQKEVWKKYGKIDSEKSEKALMRHVLSHLIQIVDLDEESCVPEEFYISPPVDDALRTGSVVQSKKDDSFYAVMNPLCDLTVRANGEINARKILLCKVASFDELAAQLPENKRNTKGRSSLKDNIDNNKKSSSHALPRTSFFGGGYLDFEFLMSVSKDLFEETFQKPALQIAPAFTKDIVARFSAYYGRQGQPTLTHAELED